MIAIVPGATPLQWCAEAERQEGHFFPGAPQQTVPFLIGWNCESHVHAFSNHRQGKETIIISLE